MSPELGVNTILENPYSSESKNKNQEQRTPFKIERNNDEARETEILRESALIYKKLFARKALAKRDFGQAMVSNYAAYLTRIGVGTRPQITSSQKAEIEKVDLFYQDILEDEFARRKTGALREFASMVSVDIALSHLKLRQNFGVLNSIRADDVHFATDFFIENKDTKALFGIQVKPMRMKQPPTQLIHPYRDEFELNNAVNNIMGNSGYYHNGHLSRTGEEQQALFLESGRRSLTLTDQTAPYIGHALLILPNNEDINMIDNFSGIPQPSMYNQITQDLRSQIFTDTQFTNGGGQ
jgi:hypothetical protein